MIYYRYYFLVLFCLGLLQMLLVFSIDFWLHLKGGWVKIVIFVIFNTGCPKFEQ